MFFECAGKKFPEFVSFQFLLLTLLCFKMTLQPFSGVYQTVNWISSVFDCFRKGIRFVALASLQNKIREAEKQRSRQSEIQFVFD